MKVLADKWKNMSEARKRPYEIQAQADNRRYRMEVRPSPCSWRCCSHAGVVKSQEFCIEGHCCQVSK